MAVLLLVYAALMVLLGLSVWVAVLELGPATIYLSLGISLLKAGLILWFFMHLRSSTPLVRIVVLVSLLWLALLFALSFDDYVFRIDRGERAPGPFERGLAQAGIPPGPRGAESIGPQASAIRVGPVPGRADHLP